MSIASSKRKSDLTRHILTTALLVSFYIFENVSYGAYISFLISVVLLGIYAIRHDFKLHLKFDRYQQYVLCFVVACLLTCIVAQYKNETIEVVLSLLKTFICLYPIYLLYDNDSSEDLVKAIMWCGFVVSVYTLIYYGVSNVISWTVNGTRLPSTMNNSNVLGMCAAFSVLITFNFLMKYGFSGYMLMVIPAVIVIAVSGSRKALLMLGVGIFLIYVTGLINRGERKRLKKLFYGVIIFWVALILISQTSMFKFVLSRMTAMLQTLIGNSATDNSTQVRLAMIDLGVELFKENPILGVGLANPRHYFGGDISNDYYYLHNNFVELLAGGGLVAFLSYYSAHMWLLVSLLRRKKERIKGDDFALIMLLIILVLDYGVVDYYSQMQYVYIMVLFLQIKRGKQYEFKKKN